MCHLHDDVKTFLASKWVTARSYEYITLQSSRNKSCMDSREKLCDLRSVKLLRDSRRSYFSMNFDTANRAMNLNFLEFRPPNFFDPLSNSNSAREIRQGPSSHYQKSHLDLGFWYLPTQPIYIYKYWDGNAVYGKSISTINHKYLLLRFW